VSDPLIRRSSSLSLLIIFRALVIGSVICSAVGGAELKQMAFPRFKLPAVLFGVGEEVLRRHMCPRGGGGKKKESGKNSGNLLWKRMSKGQRSCHWRG